MIDIATLITILILVAIGGTLICIGVFFIPVGGAPAAMATATGLATGCEMLAAGSGITGLLMTAALHIQPGIPGWLIVLNGGISSALMLCVTFVICNLLLIFGRGIVPALATAERDPVTKEHVKKYITPGTVGHGVPTACFISGVIGGFLGGVGGALTATVIYRVSLGLTGLGEILGVAENLTLNPTLMALACITALGIYFINANIAAYGIRGVIEGWWDPKFKKYLPKAGPVCFIASLVFGLLAILVVGV
ncbi:MAG: tetrahydromethanopterin S-methyltransferase subunit D [Candidatus Bathyarchaeota archaeon]